jgi:hypothetical protein
MTNPEPLKLNAQIQVFRSTTDLVVSTLLATRIAVYVMPDSHGPFRCMRGAAEEYHAATE